jgi:hypothetical protein
MVVAEIMVVTALVLVAWHVVAGAGRSPAQLVLPPAPAQVDGEVPVPSAGVLFPPSPTSRPLLPGLNLDPLFWRTRLAALNTAEAQVEALEWAIVHSALQTIRRYVETVVIPAIERAEGVGKVR